MASNLITDVAGLAVGQAEDAGIASGVTVVVFDEPAIAGVDVRGGAPGTRETDLLDVERTVERIDAIVLSGGSAFGLDAASGVMAALAEAGRGFQVGAVRVPIVPTAILFDLLNGGDKAWGRFPPYRELGYRAAKEAGIRISLGSHGAGFGAQTARLKGGLGSASARVGDLTVGALVAVNALGSVTIGEGPHFWAAPFEQGAEFGGLGFPPKITAADLAPVVQSADPRHTTIAVVASDAVLSKPQARHLAVMAQDGLARAIHPIHSPLDGDTVFAAATGRRELGEPLEGMVALGTAAAQVLARACARAIYEATALPFPGSQPAWRDHFLAPLS
jgi:L-aminopeptidase/D-esterase-like protein